VADSFRNAAPWLSQPHKVRNFTDLYNVIVVYAWLANDDRNLGNVLARPIRGSEIEVVMIDFEKSKALRPNPLMGSANVEARKLWPTGELGQELRRQKPLFPGHPVVERIENLGSNRCSEIIAAVVEKVGPIPWSGNSIEALSRRATRIAQIAGEIWKQN